MNESQLTRLFCKGLERHNALVYSAVGGRFGRNGWPDRYVHHARWQGWLEFKTGAGHLSPLQKEVMRKLIERKPGSAYVVRLHSDAAGLIENIEAEFLNAFTSVQEFCDILFKGE